MGGGHHLSQGVHSHGKQKYDRDSTSVGVHRGSTRGLGGGEGLGAMEMVKGKQGHFTEFPICSWQRVGKD